ncbi:hypothetical protein SLA2020_342830 [Shorea laevis]
MHMIGKVGQIRSWKAKYTRPSVRCPVIEDQETKEKLKKIDEDLMSKFIRKWRGLFQKFSEEGTTEKFEAIRLKVKEEEERQWREMIDEFFEEWERGEPSGTAPPGDHIVANIVAILLNFRLQTPELTMWNRRTILLIWRMKLQRLTTKEWTRCCHLWILASLNSSPFKS